MKKGKTLIGQRIRRARQERDMRQEELAKKVGVDTSTVSNWETGKSRPRWKVLPRLAEVLEKPLSWFMDSAYSIDEGSEFRERLTRIPVLGNVPAGELVEVSELPPEYIFEALKCSNRAFAVRIRGDSMEPELHDGDIVIVDPAVELKSGQIALVRNGKEVTVKKVVLQNGVVILQPFNHCYEPRVIFGDLDVVIGPIVRVVRDYKR